MEANLHEAALRLRDESAAISPEQRRDLVQAVADALLCRELEEERDVAEVIEQLAADPDWAVRLEVAKMAHLLSDELCSRLVARFRRDCNRYVRSHAERCVVRQRKARQSNERGLYVRLDSARLAAKLHPRLAQNTLAQAIKALRDRITAVMKERLRLECGPEDVLANGGQGYHLRQCVVVEEHEETGALPHEAATSNGTRSVDADERFGQRQRWVLAQLASGVRLTRRAVQEQFNVSDRTAKRYLGELVEADLIEFDRSEHPGFYRLK